MCSKKLTAVVLSLVLVLSLAMSLAAAAPSENTSHYAIEANDYGVVEAVEQVNYDASCTERQFERLMELMQENVATPFSDDGAAINVPRVNFILPPEGGRNYFLIGVVDEPTAECIEFILAYTGIPRSQVQISKAIAQRL